MHMEMGRTRLESERPSSHRAVREGVILLVHLYHYHRRRGVEKQEAAQMAGDDCDRQGLGNSS